MHKLLELDKATQKVTPSAYARHISFFDAIIKRDRGSVGDAQGRNKLQACKELAYIFHMCDHTSPYANYLPDSRQERLIKELFPKQDWKPDKLVEDAMEYYKEISESSIVKLLKASRSAVASMEAFLSEANVNDEEDSYKATKDLLSSLASIGKVVDSLKRLEELAKQEGEEVVTYGNVKLNKYSQK